VRRTSPVVCDERFAPSVAFGLEAERLGAEVVRTHGDITDFRGSAAASLVGGRGD
jgi:hypothetical protein